MTLLTILAIFATLTGTLAQNPSSLTNVTNAFMQARIVPDILPSFSPSALIDFRFSSDNTLPGQLIPVPGMFQFVFHTTATKPSFALESNDTTLTAQRFVVAIVDPDAGANAQVRHFLGGNFVLNNNGGSVMTLANTTPALSEYVQPAPPPGTGAHRYTILAFIQPSAFDQTAPRLINSSTPITKFNLSTFSAAINLGNPIAGNYFLAANNTQTETTTSASSPSPSSTSKNGGLSTKFVMNSLPFCLLFTPFLLFIQSSVVKYL
ncbi:Phosphatidylethanolamine-binding protein PEBP [Amanita muscaria]